MLKDALAGDKAARRIIWSEAARLFPDEVDRSQIPSMGELNASDQRSLAELRAMLLDGLMNIDEDHADNEDESSAGDEA